MKFQMKTKRLLDFLKYCRMKAGKKKEYLLDSFLIEAKNDELIVRRSDVTLAVFLDVRETEVKVVQDGALPIGDADQFEGFLGRMGKEVTVEYDGTRVVMHDGSKTAKFQPVAQEVESMKEDVYRKTDDGFIDLPGAELRTSFEVDASLLKGVVDDGEHVGVVVFPISVGEDGKVEVAVGKPEGELITTKIATSDFRGEAAEATYNMGFPNLFSNLTGLVRIVMATDKPMFVEKIDKNFRLVALMAPMVERDE